MKRNRILLTLALIVLNLVFIWGNSMLPAVQSAQISGRLHEFLLRWLPFLAGGGEKLLRKLAHAWEFAVLGVLLRLLFRLLGERGWRATLMVLLLGMMTGLADETIQLFVPNRGPGLLDVWIDTGGVCIGMVLFALADRCIKMILERKTIK